MPTVPPIDPDLVAGLVADQFPEWGGLPVRPVAVQGWDNRTFRLGDRLSVRLPSAEGYAEQVVKERRWLPHLAGHLPLPVPAPVALGRPGRGYPFRWSVSRWLDGEVLSRAGADPVRFGVEVAAFLVALRAVPAAGGPPAGAHSFWRGAPLDHYAADARQAFGRLDRPAAARAEEVLAAALASRWEREPVWFHGDVAADNLLVRDGHLHGVLDFGCSGVGDPACDLVLAWTWLDDPGRLAFRRAVDVDGDTWRRGRGWAVWKAAIQLANDGTAADRRAGAERALAAVLADAATDP